MTASLVIPDVRIDDTVEIAMTFYGTNPALGLKFSGWAGFDAFNPWSTTRHRLLRPAHRVAFEKEFNRPPKPEVQVRGDSVDSRWELAGQERLEREDLTSAWAMETPSLQFSEYEDWGEVAKLFAPYYIAALPSELVGAVDQIAADHPDPAQRAMEWLRFVQRELRYFSLSLGEGGFVPRQPDEIWRTRFGDCNDAVQLYVAGARRLGLDACPALLSTTHGPLLDQFLPSPTVFNHCIARLRIDGRSYWLDPTMRLQSGDLGVVVQPFGGWALPLGDSVSALEPLSDPGVRHYLDFQETLQLGPKRDSIATYLRTVEYRFWAADELRGGFAVEGTDPYARKVLKELRTVWPEIEQGGNVEVDDDRAANRIRVSTRYQLRDFWKTGGKNQLSLVIGDEAFAQQLAPLSRGSRRNAIYLGWPRKATRHMTIAMPRKWPGQGWRKVQAGGGLRYESSVSFEGRTIEYAKEFVSDSLTLRAADAQSYHDVVAQLRKNQLILRAKERFGRLGSVASRRPRAQRIVSWAILVFSLLMMIATKLRH